MSKTSTLAKQARTTQPSATMTSSKRNTRKGRTVNATVRAKQSNAHRLEQSEDQSEGVESARYSHSSSKLKAMFFDALAVVSIVLVVYLIVVLTTYHPSDPGFNYLGASVFVHNSGGAVGAYISDVMLTIVGYLGYLLPLMLGLKAVNLLRKRETYVLNPLLLMARVLGIMVFVSACSGLFSLFLPSFSALPVSSGGALGDVIADKSIDLFNSGGAGLILVAALLIGTTLLFDISWTKCFLAIIPPMLSLFPRVGSRFFSSAKDKLQSIQLSDDASAPVSSAKALSFDESGRLEPDIPDLSLPELEVLEEDVILEEEIVQAPVKSRKRSRKSAEVPKLDEAQVLISEPQIQESQVSESQVQENPLQEIEQPQPQMKRQAKKAIPTRLRATASGKVTAQQEALEQEAPTDTAQLDVDRPEVELEPEPEVLSKPEKKTGFFGSGAKAAAKLASKLKRESKVSVSIDLNEPNISDADEDELNSELSLEPTSAAATPAAVNKRKTKISAAERGTSDAAIPSKPQTRFKSTSKADIPNVSLLDLPEANNDRGYSEEELESLSQTLEEKLGDFGILASVTDVLPGPVVTRFEIQPAPGIKVSRITNLAKDLARSLAVISVRVVEVIPGKTVVGIEIPNQERELIRLSEVIASKVYDSSKSMATLSLGKDIAGEPIVADLAKMPHLLVAGTTGSGKSVGLNAMLISMLLKATPDELRMIMIDPKMLELSIYDDIPHLLTPVVTDMKDAANALRWCVGEMERRYKLMAALGVRNLAGYNRKVREAIEAGSPIPDPINKPTAAQMDEALQGGPAPEIMTLEMLPMVVVVIDEFADMMMVVGKKVEELIARIAQKARAAGIHLILATQRPSVNVITGLIKANVPTRIAFQVSSKVDSRTILDQGGAEQLLGHGDMLYLPPGTSLPVRVHGAFVSDEEVHRITDAWRLNSEPDYLDEVLEGQAEGAGDVYIPGGDAASQEDESDPLYDQAIAFVTQTRKASISSVQRKLKIGYNRAARLVESMEMAGVITPMQHNGSREVLAPPPVDL